MPVKRRSAKRRVHEFSWEVWMDLSLGPNERWKVFEDDAERRAAWEVHRERLMTGINPGKRPDAWWTFESPEPYDRAVPECLQLYRIGELKGRELERCMAIWQSHIGKGLQYGYHQRGRLVPPGPEAERLWRAWSGCPDELFR